MARKRLNIENAQEVTAASNLNCRTFVLRAQAQIQQTPVAEGPAAERLVNFDPTVIDAWIVWLETRLEARKILRKT